MQTLTHPAYNLPASATTPRNTPCPFTIFHQAPPTLPESVLRTAQQEMLDYNGTGISVMTMSHRSDAFLSILHYAEQDLRSLMNIPGHYKILFLQGGALAQFTQVALNLAQNHQRVDAVITGNWSRIAAEQMGKLSPHLNVHIAAHGGEQFNYTNLPAPETWDISRDFRLCALCDLTKPSTACNTTPSPSSAATRRPWYATFPPKSCRARLTCPTSA